MPNIIKECAFQHNRVITSFCGTHNILWNILLTFGLNNVMGVGTSRFFFNLVFGGFEG